MTMSGLLSSAKCYSRCSRAAACDLAIITNERLPPELACEDVPSYSYSTFPLSCFSPQLVRLS